MIQGFDQLNNLSSTMKKSSARKKIPIYEYFDSMALSEEEKSKRVRLALILLSDMLFIFALSKRTSDKKYLSETLAKRYSDTVSKITEPDKKMERYIKKMSQKIVEATQRHSDDEYYTSADRATNIAENEANTIMNGDEHRRAVKNGCNKKKWLSYGDERVREAHAEVDGVVIDIDKPFHVGDSLMMYPKDDSLGASADEIVGCRCSVEYMRSTGGRTFSEYLKRDEEAEKYYDTIRRRTDDVEKISANTKMSYKDVETIKNHMFFNKHILDNGTGRFDADYNIAISWQRLINGKYEERDIVLLNHELLESKVEKEYNLNYRDAHIIAQEKYPWWNKVCDVLGEDGENADLSRIIGEERK